jgi:hypothetical protein
MPNSFPLRVTSEAITALRALHAAPKFTDLPGDDTAAEQARCSSLVDQMLDRLIQGIAANPRKSWVLEQWVQLLELACHEDTEARERFGPYLEQIMDILGIETSDGMLNFYLAMGGVDAV